MKNLILVLGGPNDDQGILSPIAIDRLNCAYDLYRFNKDVRIICTGGIGKSFNTTAQPHASYARAYLIQKGVRECDLLEYILSSHTVDDMRMSKDRIMSLAPSLLMVVTSDFHMERVSILYNLLISYPSVVFIPAKSSLSATELEPLILHEKEAIDELKKNNYHVY